MKNLSLRNDLDRIITYKNQLNELIDSINKTDIFNSKEICLDLTGYYVDYQVTPNIVSFFLTRLSAMDGVKEFKIIHSGIGSKEELMLYDLLFDNDFFKIKNKPTEETVVDYKKTINIKLKEKNILMNIECPHDKIIYNYGI